MTTSPSLAGLSAVVTGAGSGIGLATVDRLAHEGANVAAIDLDPAAAVKAKVTAEVDVSDRVSVNKAVDGAASAFDGLDIVVNCAGIGATGGIEDTSEPDWRRIVDVNLFGVVNVCVAALPHLRRSKNAAIVNVCSTVAAVGVPGRAAYSATKGAVLSLTRAIAADHVAEGIRVNGVNPGTTDTPWVGRLLAEATDPAQARVTLEGRQPIGRLLTPDEVASAIVYLASPQSSGVTGSVTTVDGGMVGLRMPAPVRAGGS